MTNRSEYISSKLSSLFKFIDCVSLKSVSTSDDINKTGKNKKFCENSEKLSGMDVSEKNKSLGLDNRSKSELALNNNNNNHINVPKIKVRTGSLRKLKNNTSKGVITTKSRLDDSLSDVRIATGYNPLTRDGIIRKNQFRGIKKELLEKQTNLIILSMTVCIFGSLFV